MFKFLKISSPGKIILGGEHSVVYGKKALSCSISLRTTLTAKKINTNKFIVKLNDLNKQIELDEHDFTFIRSLCPENKPDLVIKYLESFEQSDKIYDSLKFFILSQSDLKWSNLSGLLVDVNSEIPLSSGLGSSASYSTCLSAFFLVINSNTRNFTSHDLETINNNAFYVERLFHGKPSGLDNSVSTYGNFIVFEKGKIIEKFQSNNELNVLIVNSGIPKKTLEQVKKVRNLYEKHEGVVESLMNAIDVLVGNFITHLKESGSIDKIKDLITINQGLLFSLQVSSDELNSIVSLSQNFGFHSKITGAGGGGCCITLLDAPNSDRVFRLISCLKENNFVPFQTRLGCEGVRVENFQD